MGEGADGVEHLAQRHGAARGQATEGGFQADEVIPRRRDTDRTAGIRADGGGGEALGHRDGPARGGAARDRLIVIDAGRRRGDRVQAEAREGQFRHMGFAETDRALQRRGAQGVGVLRRGAAFQQGGTGLGRYTRRIEQVFP